MTDREMQLELRATYANIDAMRMQLADHGETITRLETEIERLQKDKTQIAEAAARLEAELYAVLSERNVQATKLEELQAANKLLRTAYLVPEDKVLQAENERLRGEVAILRTTEAAENERWRVALKQAADDLDENGLPVEAKQARRALETKP